MPVELAVDLSALALYDIIIYGDDSGSMESGDGERIQDLQLIVAKVAEVATLFDDDGIEVRTPNTLHQTLVVWDRRDRAEGRWGPVLDGLNSRPSN